MSRQARQPKKRRGNRNAREPKQCILIVCEGEKTEPNYFKALKKSLRVHLLATVEIDGKGCGSAPSSVVAKAIELKGKRKIEAKSSPVVVEYDHVWCVMDVEAPQAHNTLSAAIDRAKRHRLSVILSNPCFELTCSPKTGPS